MSVLPPRDSAARPGAARGAAEYRRKQLAAIHVRAKQRGLDDEAYRAMLQSVAGVDSAAELDEAGRRRVLDHLGGRRRIAAAPEKRALIAKIRAMLGERPEAYAEAILRRMTHHDHRVPLAWGTPLQLRKVVAALNYDHRRRTGGWSGKGDAA